MEILQKSYKSVGQKAFEARQSDFLIAGYCSSLLVKVSLFPNTFQQWRKAFFLRCLLDEEELSSSGHVDLTSGFQSSL